MEEYVKIYCCGDCIYYNRKKRKCNIGAKNERKAQDNFFRDCPLGITTNIENERRKAIWEKIDILSLRQTLKCPVCGYHHYYMPAFEAKNFCPNCGSDMRESE